MPDSPAPTFSKGFPRMNLAGWTAVAYWSGAVIALGGMMASPFFPQRHHQRRVYWGCWLVGGSVLTLVGEHAAPGQGWLFAAMMAVSSVTIAFFKSPYIKIGGRIYSARLDERQPDPPRDGRPAPDPEPLPADRYSDQVSAGTFWWLLALAGTGSSIVVLDSGWTFHSYVLAAMSTAALAWTGRQDGRGDYSVARGRYLPATVSAAAGVAMFLIPVAAYLGSFTLTRRNRRPSPSSDDQPAYTPVSKARFEDQR